MIGTADGVRISITGLGCHVPERVVTNDELSTMMDTSDEWIRERTGIRERPHRRAGGKRCRISASPLRAKRSRDAGSAGSEIDLIIVATVTPDMAFPSTAAILADQLGAENAAAYDLSAGCTGFMYAVAQGYGMLAGGLAQKALVVGGRRALEDPRLERPRYRRSLRAMERAPSCSSVSRTGASSASSSAPTAPAALSSTCPAGALARQRRRSRLLRRLHFVKMNGREVFKFATRVLVSSAESVLTECGLTIEDVDVYVPAPGERPDHRAREAEARGSGGEDGDRRRPLRKHVVGLDSACSGGREGRRTAVERQARVDDRNGCRTHMGLRFDRMDRRRNGMSGQKVAFCFPGQGSLAVGMGREIALAVPEAMDVYRRASEASGLDLVRICFEAPEAELVQTEVQQPALVATSLAVLAALRAEGYEPDVVVGHSVGEFAALAAAQALSVEDAIALVRERGLAMAEAARENPGSMAAILGLEDAVVEGLCKEISGVWPANYNCPGQIVISGQDPAVDECCTEAQLHGAARTVKLRVSGAFHSPLIARAAERLRPAIEKAKINDPIAPFMSTVTAKIEPAQRMAALLVEQLTAPVRFTQAARELMRQGVKVFVEVGPGNVLSGLLKRIDRNVKAIPVADLASLEKLRGDPGLCLTPSVPSRARPRS
jgi:[acyl-carrier-protein] S-malonyltransferase